MNEVDDRALPDAVVDRGQQIGGAAHDQDLRERERARNHPKVFQIANESAT